MTEGEILGWLIAAVSFAAGFGTGHLRGQSVGIRWCIEREAEFDRIYGKIRDLKESA